MLPSASNMMDRVRDLALAAAIVGLMFCLAHGAAALAAIVNDPGKPVCINPRTGLNDVK